MQRVACAIFGIVWGLSAYPTAVFGQETPTLSVRLDLPVDEVRTSHPPYASFCARSPEYCDMTGSTVIAYTDDHMAMLLAVNSAANKAIDCQQSDQELFGEEDFWTYPVNGLGDCEDIAIYKREELVSRGLPRGAMTVAIVHHKTSMYAHAVLLIETTNGTFLLDSVSDDVQPWHKAPYNFEARERPDGSWERFDQSIWVFE